MHLARGQAAGPLGAAILAVSPTDGSGGLSLRRATAAPKP